MNTNKNNGYHAPVMLSECIEGLNINPQGIYVDTTFGGGGHARAIFERLGQNGQLIAFDQDKDAQKNAWTAPNFQLITSNFAFLKNQLKILNIHSVDGIIADLGVSSYQFDAHQRGFSIRSDAPLDMRMNQKNELTAQQIVNTYAETDLVHILKTYGELRNARQIASEIVKQRTQRKIQTTHQLINIIEKYRPPRKEFQFYAQVFQALRIEVNQELAVLEQFLVQTQELIKPEGRLVVLSYHSLEDRLVKNYLKRGNLEGEVKKDFFGNSIRPFREIVRHPLTPTEKEIAENPRSRSAKLRIGERTSDD